ncbi:MAG: type III secretion system outer membrane ring subunit SctC [Kiritimatiellae bacterium]|nr:type III secretion system outer membrane ring subunit SctC [Kiritimatiellia bacterium]
MKRFAILMIAALALCGADGAEIPWKLPTYTLVARDMDLRVAFDTFAVAQGLSVVMSDSVSGVFSGDFRDVPPAEFLDKIAITHNLIWYYDGAALYIYGSGEIATILLDLRYMKAGEVRSMLAELGVEDSRFPLKTTSNDELMMVSGPPRYVSLVAETVAKADKLREMRTFNEVEIRLFPLMNTWADDVTFSISTTESSVSIRGVAHLLEELMDAGSSRVRESVGTNYVGEAKSQLEEMSGAAFRPMIKPENRLNAVLVRDVKSRLPMYGELIRQLDVPQKLVEVDVTVVELSKNDAMDWQLSLKVEGTKNKTTGAAGQNAANLVQPANLGGQGLAGALTYLGNDATVSASLSALKSKGKARSISRTSLITMNNLAAQMTDMQSYHAKVVGTEVASLEEVTAGTKLQIKPRIVQSPSTNVANQVWLTLELDDGGFETLSVDSMPMTRSSTLLTQTAVFENESIMLAGYLRDIEEEAGWGIPYLRDIPFIGWLFGGAYTHKETVQRMFILTPRIVDLDAEMLARLQSTRLRDITEVEKIQDEADDSDLERRQRDLERKEASSRRHNSAQIRYNHRKAEVEHNQEMRKIDREQADAALKDEKREWRQEEREAREQLKAEREAKKEASETKTEEASE